MYLSFKHSIKYGICLNNLITNLFSEEGVDSAQLFLYFRNCLVFKLLKHFSALILVVIACLMQGMKNFTRTAANLLAAMTKIDTNYYPEVLCRSCPE